MFSRLKKKRVQPGAQPIEQSTMDRITAPNCSQEDFVLLYSKLVEDCHPGIGILMTAPLTLELTLENGKKSTTFLNNLWIQWKSAEDRADLVNRHINAMLAILKPGPPIERRQIIPIVKDSIYVRDYGGKMIFEHYVGDLYCIYAIDWEDRTETLSIEQMTKLGLEQSTLRDLAIENLQGILPEAECHGEGPWYMLSAGTDYVASLLLLDGVWDQLAEMVDGDLVAVAPARDTLLFTGANSSEGLAFIRK
jgi:uncharacterized protein YtpQ (UPF0354 family)